MLQICSISELTYDAGILGTMAEMEYSGEFFAGMEDANLTSARVVIPLAINLIAPKSAVDIGCGQGLWLKACIENGVEDVRGYDGEYVERNKLHIPKEKFTATDLEKPLQFDRAFDMAICVEVAEHISHDSSRTLVDNLTKAAPVILFSAAIPGQQGVHHINEQWPAYWEERFKEKGYIPVDAIRRHILSNKKVAFFYAQNILIYVKESALVQYPKLQEEIISGHGNAHAFVHPQLYTYYESRWTKIAPLIWKVPLPLIKMGKRLLSRK